MSLSGSVLFFTAGGGVTLIKLRSGFLKCICIEIFDNFFIG